MSNSLPRKPTVAVLMSIERSFHIGWHRRLISH